MIALALSSTSTIPEFSNPSFEELPSKQQISNPILTDMDINFPSELFDMEGMEVVDDLLTDLGITPEVIPASEDEADVAAAAALSDTPSTQETHELPSNDDSIAAVQTAATTEIGSTSALEALSSSNEGTLPLLTSNTSITDVQAGSFIRTVSTDSVPNVMSTTTTSFDTTKMSSLPPVPNPILQLSSAATATTTTATSPSPEPIAPKSSSSSSDDSVASKLSKTSPPSSPKKRRRALLEKDLSPEEMEERRERNRSHAKRSRQRKKELTGLLQESVEELRKENEKLREILSSSIGSTTFDGCMEERRQQNRNDFLSLLMDPKNRVFDVAGMGYMRKLRNAIPKQSATFSS